MTFQEAFHFIEKIDFTPGDTWADLGAGSGTFTSPISQFLGGDGKIYAVDSDPNVLSLKQNNSSKKHATIFPIQSDFTKPLDLPPLDGIFLANALHFVKDQSGFLQQIISKLNPYGRIVFIEYDREVGNPWVPYPIPFWKLKNMTSSLNLTEAIKLNQKTSIYGNGEMYLAISEKRN